MAASPSWGTRGPLNDRPMAGEPPCRRASTAGGEPRPGASAAVPGAVPGLSAAPVRIRLLPGWSRRPRPGRARRAVNGPGHITRSGNADEPVGPPGPDGTPGIPAPSPVHRFRPGLRHRPGHGPPTPAFGRRGAARIPSTRTPSAPGRRRSGHRSRTDAVGLSVPDAAARSLARSRRSVTGPEARGRPVRARCHVPGRDRPRPFRAPGTSPFPWSGGLSGPSPRRAGASPWPLCPAGR